MSMTGELMALEEQRDGLRMLVEDLEARVRGLEAENAQLRKRSSEPSQTAPIPPPKDSDDR